MNRRQLFGFLAAAPVAMSAALVSSARPAQPAHWHLPEVEAYIRADLNRAIKRAEWDQIDCDHIRKFSDGSEACGSFRFFSQRPRKWCVWEPRGGIDHPQSLEADRWTDCEAADFVQEQLGRARS